MMRKLLGIFILALLTGPLAIGQGKPLSEDSFLENLQKRDSVLIGDQLRYGFHLKGIPADAGVLLPDFSKGFMPGDSVEIVRSWTADTLRTVGGKKGPKHLDVDFYLLITSFEEGDYLLPPLSVIQEKTAGEFDTLKFKPLELQVFTIPVDTTTYVIHDIKGQIKYPVTFQEVLPYLAAVLLAALLVFLIRSLIIARRRKTSPEAAPDEPAYLVALRKLEKYRSDKYWVKDKQKAFYSGITDTLREYIDARYGIDAPEMTTAEIFDSLGKTDVPADLFVQTKDLFETADMVKFAKAFASDEENAAAVPLAVRFVTSTYQVSPVPVVRQAHQPDEGPVVRQAHQPDMTEEGGTE